LARRGVRQRWEREGKKRGQKRSLRGEASASQKQAGPDPGNDYTHLGESRGRKKKATEEEKREGREWSPC